MKEKKKQKERKRESKPQMEVRVRGPSCSLKSFRRDRTRPKEKREGERTNNHLHGKREKEEVKRRCVDTSVYISVSFCPSLSSDSNPWVYVFAREERCWSSSVGELL